MFRQILVPLDRSALAEQALGRAAAIARASHAAVDVMLAHEPLPFGAFSDVPWHAEQWTEEVNYLESVVQEMVSGATIAVSHNVLRGAAVEMICQRAHEIDADLIVMTSHGRTGLSRLWLGSVADGVIRRSRVPVLVLRPIGDKNRREATKPFGKILVPLDGSALAAEALTSATALAKCSNARIVLLRVVQPIPLIMTDVGMPFTYPAMVPDEIATEGLIEEAKKEMSEVSRRTRAETGLDVDAFVIEGPSVAQAILDFARGHNVDAIALSTHGRGASRLLVGSVADKVLRASELPTLLHRPALVGEASNESTTPLVAEQKPSLTTV
jgi:nucleotide-binding universal stress UspA family protein